MSSDRSISAPVPSAAVPPPAHATRAQARPWKQSEKERNMYGDYGPWAAYNRKGCAVADGEATRSPKGQICAVCQNVYRDLGSSTGRRIALHCAHGKELTHAGTRCRGRTSHAKRALGATERQHEPPKALGHSR